MRIAPDYWYYKTWIIISKKHTYVCLIKSWYFFFIRFCNFNFVIFASLNTNIIAAPRCATQSFAGLWSRCAGGSAPAAALGLKGAFIPSFWRHGGLCVDPLYPFTEAVARRKATGWRVIKTTSGPSFNTTLYISIQDVDSPLEKKLDDGCVHFFIRAFCRFLKKIG